MPPCKVTALFETMQYGVHRILTFKGSRDGAQDFFERNSTSHVVAKRKDISSHSPLQHHGLHGHALREKFRLLDIDRQFFVFCLLSRGTYQQDKYIVLPLMKYVMLFCIRQFGNYWGILLAMIYI